MKEYASSLAVSLLAVFAPIQAMIIVVGIVIFVDLFTGIMAAMKRGEKITSAGLRRTITKIFIYQTAIMVGYLIEFYLMGGTLPISKIAAGLIGSTEALSIFENLNTIHGKNVFKAFIVKFGSVNDPGKKSE